MPISLCVVDDLVSSLLLVCVLALAGVGVSLTSAASSPELLSWLSSLPFNGAAHHAPRVDGGLVRVGDDIAPGTPNPTPVAADAPAASAGSSLSDSFQTTAVRRGLFAQQDMKNETEIMRIPFDHMFNYSSTFGVDHPLPEAFNELILSVVQTGAVLDSQALLAMRLLLQVQHGHEWKKEGGSKSSHWESFINDLPKPSSICFYSAAELENLQIPVESPILAARNQQLDTITESYLAFDEILKSQTKYSTLFPSGFTEKWYRWAYGVVLNQAFEVPVRDVHGVQGALLVLIPVLNHVNHANPPYFNARLVWNNEATQKVPLPHEHTPGSPDHTPAPMTGYGSLSFIAARDIRSGEEITFTYGSMSAVPLMILNETTLNVSHPELHHHDAVESHTSRQKASNSSDEAHFTDDSFFQPLGLSNSQLLVHYGFALPANEFERVALDVGLDAESEMVAEHHYDMVELKRQIIDLNDLDHGTLVGLDGRLDAYFIQALRTKHLTAEDLHHLAANEYEFSPEHGYLSLQNELKWQLQMVVSLENLLATYPTTLQTDLTDLRTTLNTYGRSAHSNHTMHAVAYRVTLKRIVHALILRSLHNIHELFLNVSTNWSEQLHKHNVEEEGLLAKHAPPSLSAEEKTKLMNEWNEEQKKWFGSMEGWKAEMDQWESNWTQWVSAIMGSTGLIEQLPPHNVDKRATSETLDEMLDPSIHALQLEHEEEDDGTEVDMAEENEPEPPGEGAMAEYEDMEDDGHDEL